jgi:hypothetical protein
MDMLSLLVVLMIAAVDAGPAISGTLTGVVVRWATAPFYMIAGREPITVDEYRAFKAIRKTVAIGLSFLYLILELLTYIVPVLRELE